MIRKKPYYSLLNYILTIGLIMGAICGYSQSKAELDKQITQLEQEIAYTNQIRKENVFYGYERTEIAEAIPVNDFDQGLLFGIGSQIKKFGFETFDNV